MLISQQAAAKEIGLSRQTLNHRILKKYKDGQPYEFVQKNRSGIFKIENTHPGWEKFKIECLTEKQGLTLTENTDLVNEEKTKIIGAKEEYKEVSIYNETHKKEIQELLRSADIAQLKKTIYIAKINEEKSKQEEIKTLERKKELAPINLLKLYFSFEENLIQRIYRRPHEISPQLKALFIADEDMKAEQLMIRELEGIVKDSHKELLKAIKEEGFRVKKEI